MLSILPGHLIAALDKKYVQKEQISSWELMERAANAFSTWFLENYSGRKREVFVFAGPGNNGGDGLAIARLLFDKGYAVTVVLFSERENSSLDWQKNFDLLPEDIGRFEYPSLDLSLVSGEIVIDALFGVGINRPLEGKYKDVIVELNQLTGEKIAIDIPSGLPADTIVEGEAFKADVTVSFQFPKLSLLTPDHVKYVGGLKVLDLGIPDEFLKEFGGSRCFLRSSDIPVLHKYFHKFSHKGDFGRILLIGGRKGKVGAIILSAKSALRSGSGLVHVWAEGASSDVIHIACTEVMVEDEQVVKGMDKFDAVGIGPGLGEVPLMLLGQIFRSFDKPMVLDADALNLLSKHEELWDFVPKGSILTPHPKEFERLAGKSKNHFERLEKASSLAVKRRVFVVLKGAFTCISAPDGMQYFNSTGNKHMATAGSGDVLTGMITSFLGQGYSPLNACICGVFHHGLAGEIASKTKVRGMIASDITESIPSSFLEMNID